VLVSAHIRTITLVHGKVNGTGLADPSLAVCADEVLRWTLLAERLGRSCFALVRSVHNAVASKPYALNNVSERETDLASTTDRPTGIFHGNGTHLFKSEQRS
jgi:hypothetical protein